MMPVNSVESVISDADLIDLAQEQTAIELMTSAAGFVHAAQVFAARYPDIKDRPAVLVEFVELIDTKADELEKLMRVVGEAKS